MQESLFTRPQDLEQPDLRIVFRKILSQNDITGDRFQRSNQIDLWRERGTTRAIETAKMLNIPIENFRETVEYKYRGKNKLLKGKLVTKHIEGTRLIDTFFNEPIFMVVRMWRANFAPYDIHNLFIKPVIDGFTDANIFPDDNTTFIPFLLFKHEGVDKTLALSKEKQLERKMMSEKQKTQRQNAPANKLIYFDMWKLSRLRENYPLLLAIMTTPDVFQIL